MIGGGSGMAAGVGVCAAVVATGAGVVATGAGGKLSPNTGGYWAGAIFSAP